MLDTNRCPCGSETNLIDCCLPLIQGKKQATRAEDLLRARYTAFTRGDIEFVLATHHSKTRHEVKREEIEDWSKNSEWLNLQIVKSEQGQKEDQKGTLIFVARYRADGKEQEHWEKSFFE